MNQLYKLFGSFDLLGNPVSLIESLGTGMIDMFYEPIYGLVKGKGVYKFGENVAMGGNILVFIRRYDLHIFYTKCLRFLDKSYFNLLNIDKFSIFVWLKL
jgi:hypothetical protein